VRAGEIQAFTGISDPFEVPTDPSISVDTSTIDVDGATNAVLACLTTSGSLPSA
jgi:sulfate adenylyltransferase